MTKIPLIFVLVILSLSHSYAQQPDMRMEDKVRIREAMNISKLYAGKFWRGINDAPFPIILVTDSVEFLLNHPSPSADFTLLGDDPVLGTNMYYRRATFNKHFLSTFPAVKGLNTIVVGTPENTGTNSTSWITTILHEHFHQYVYTSPGYYEAVNLLNLSGGDQSGMWMLNYPFPYGDSAVVRQYGVYTRALTQTLSTIGADSFGSQFRVYLAERKRFQQLLKPADYRYFSFQVWQEGIARYTEYKFLELLGEYAPSKEVASLPDYIPFGKYREQFYQNQTTRITQWDLNEHRRDCFYAVGLGEGLILDRLDPTWREKYLSEKFYIEHYSRAFHLAK